MTKQEIMNRVNTHLEYAKKEIGFTDDQFVGIFVYGSTNYGTATEDSDIDTKLIILPTFEDMCLNRQPVSKELHVEDEHCEVKDLRLMREMWMKQNINFVEVLFTDYCIINPKYKELFDKYFVDKREAIAHGNPYKAVSSISGQAMSGVLRLATPKTVYNAWRLYYFLSDYVEGVSYEKCLKQTGKRKEQLMRIKRGSFTPEEASDIAELLLKFKERYEFLLFEESESAAAAFETLNTGVIEIIKASLNEFCPNAPTKSTFMSKLTNAEERAYYAIVNTIGSEGNVTVSKLVDSTNISRPVYNNLFNKLKENNIATVTNMGVKGMYIKITQPELRAEAEEL